MKRAEIKSYLDLKGYGALFAQHACVQPPEMDHPSYLKNLHQKHLEGFVCSFLYHHVKVSLQVCGYFSGFALNGSSTAFSYSKKTMNIYQKL